jgi:hypothetical protein
MLGSKRQQTIKIFKSLEQEISTKPRFVIWIEVSRFKGDGDEVVFRCASRFPPGHG